jgi:hypothetical protein
MQCADEAATSSARCPPREKPEEQMERSTTTTTPSNSATADGPPRSPKHKLVDAREAARYARSYVRDARDTLDDLMTELGDRAGGVDEFYREIALHLRAASTEVTDIIEGTTLPVHIAERSAADATASKELPYAREQIENARHAVDRLAHLIEGSGDDDDREAFLEAAQALSGARDAIIDVLCGMDKAKAVGRAA